MKVKVCLRAWETIGCYYTQITEQQQLRAKAQVTKQTFFSPRCGGMQNDMRKIASHSLVLSQTHTHTNTLMCTVCVSLNLILQDSL